MDETVFETRIRAKNQLTLPAKLIQAAGLRIGDKFTVALVNGSIVLTPLTSTSLTPFAAN